MMLNTDRLVLREFVADDWHAVLAYQSDSRYLLLRFPRKAGSCAFGQTLLE